MTWGSWLLLLGLAGGLGIGWGSLALRRSELLESRSAGLLFWASLIVATTVIYLVVLREWESPEPAAPVSLPLPRADAPRAFGPECHWMALRDAEPENIGVVLKLYALSPSDWAHGVEAAHHGRVFITPALDGWTLVASSRMPRPATNDELTAILEKLGTVFPDVQYFGASHVGEVAWARVLHGKFTRKLALANNEILWNSGSDFDAETTLGLELARPDSQWKTRPTAIDVFQIARAWSLDPQQLGSLNLPPSTGFVAGWDP